MRKRLVVLTLLAISALAGAPAVAQNQFSLGTGFDYSSGQYGNATSTDILYIPVTGKCESDKLTLKLTVPYISITGPGGVVQGIGRVRTTTKATKTTSSGLGDITASAGYSVYSVDSLAFDVVGNVKFGTADANKGLGTGKNDYSAQIDGYYTHDKTTLFATAGYKIYGAPAGVNLGSVPYGTAGASQKLGGKTSAGVMVYVAKSPGAASSDQQEITVFASRKLTSNLKIQVNILSGLSNGSPDFGGGVMITGYF